MADIVTSRIFTDGERGITAQKLNDIVGSSVIQPAFYTSKPTAGTADPTDIALILKAGAYAQVPISTLAGSATQAQIWSTRLRSFNAIGNPNFEVDQRNVHGSVPYAAGNVPTILQCDRWAIAKNAATGTITSQCFNTGQDFNAPGTSFRISRSALQVSVAANQPTLAAGEYCLIYQTVEGPSWRELASDVHSLQLVCYSSVALNFSVYLRSTTGTIYSLVLPVSIPASVNTLITLPNLPLWPAGATFNELPGNAAYVMGICLGAGSTYQAPSTGAWVSGAYFGYAGQSNFLANAGANFYVRCIQHEPGSVCSTFIDKPFTQNYDECLRYYCKSYDYGTKAGTVTDSGLVSGAINTAYVLGGARFHKPMAKAPTVISYAPRGAGTINAIWLLNQGAQYGVASAPSGLDGLSYLALGGSPTGNDWAMYHYTADTGW